MQKNEQNNINYETDIITISNEFKSFSLDDQREIINILHEISNCYNEFHILWRRYAFNHIIPIKQKELWDQFNKYSSFFNLLSWNEKLISFACYTLPLIMIEEETKKSLSQTFISKEKTQ